MNLPRILLIVGALVVAGLAAFLIKNFADQKESELADAKTAKTDNTVAAVDVLVAERDLATGLILIPDHMRWLSWPKAAIQPGYVTKDGEITMKDVVGSAVRRGITKGEPVIQAKLLKPGEAGFLSGVLKPGMRAATVTVNPETGAAGFILPGDFVDIMLTRQIQVAASATVGKKFVSETIFRRMRVLAIDQVLDDLAETARVGRTVTLEVTPKQAEELAVAKRLGTISLILRSVAKIDTGEDKADTELTSGASFLNTRRRVLVSRTDLPAGTLLKDIDTTWLPTSKVDPKSGIIIDSFTSQSSLRGAFLKNPVKKNQPILEYEIIRPGEQGFILAALQPGMTAVSIPITQVTGVSGFISSGDRVDIMLTHTVNDMNPNAIMPVRNYSETIMQNVRILAMERSDSGGTASPKIGGTITVELSPRNAEKIVLATQMGTLTLAMRSIPAGDRSEEPDWAVSKLSVSSALRDFLIRGTSTDQDLMLHRERIMGIAPRSKPRRKPSKAAKTENRPAVAPAQNDTGIVRIYRSTAQSSVTVRR